MTDMMKEIMAEVERVNKLGAEVEKVVADRNAETMVCRVEKGNEIADFLREMCNSMKVAGVSGYLHVYCCGDDPTVDRYNMWKWPLGVQLHKDFFRIGHFNIMGSFSEACKLRDVFIDRWNTSEKQKVETAVAEAIKKTLAERMDKMTADLTKANADHAVYFGKENA